MFLGILFHFLVAHVVHAQVRDSAYMNYSAYDRNGNNALDAGVSSPPLFLGKIFWIQSLTFQQQKLSEEITEVSERFRPTSFGYFHLFKTEFSDMWSATLGLNVSSRNADPGLRLQRGSTFFSSFLFFNRHIGGRKNAFWSFGVVVPDRSSLLPVFPAIGYQYESVDGRHFFRLTFPTISYAYRFLERFQAGVFSRYTFGAYLLPEDSALTTRAKYLGQKTLTTGIFSRAVLGAGISLNTSICYNFWRSTTLLNEDLDKIQLIGKSRGIFFILGMGWSFR